MRNLGAYALQIDSGIAANCIFAGDFNLAPTPDLKPSPLGGDNKNVFDGLSLSYSKGGFIRKGWVAANKQHTNLLSLARGTEPRVYDNFLVHTDLWNGKPSAPFKLESMTCLPHGADPHQRAFVVRLDDLLCAQATALDIPEERLIKGLTSATEDPLEWLRALADVGGAEGGSAADTASNGPTAAQGVSRLGLSDHCFSFIDLSLDE